MASSGLNRLLVEEGVLGKSDAKTLKRISGHQPYSYAKSLLALGLFDEEELVEFIAEFGQCERAPRGVIDMIDERFLNENAKPLFQRLCAVPIKQSEDQNRVVIAMPDPLDRIAVERIRFFLKRSIKPVVATFTELKWTLSEVFGETSDNPTDFESFLENYSESAVAHLRHKSENIVSDASKVFGASFKTEAGQTVVRADDNEFESIGQISLDDFVDDDDEANDVLEFDSHGDIDDSSNDMTDELVFEDDADSAVEEINFDNLDEDDTDLSFEEGDDSAEELEATTSQSDLDDLAQNEFIAPPQESSDDTEDFSGDFDLGGDLEEDESLDVSTANEESLDFGEDLDENEAPEAADLEGEETERDAFDSDDSLDIEEPALETNEIESSNTDTNPVDSDTADISADEGDFDIGVSELDMGDDDLDLSAIDTEDPLSDLSPADTDDETPADMDLLADDLTESDDNELSAETEDTSSLPEITEPDSNLESITEPVTESPSTPLPSTLLARLSLVNLRLSTSQGLPAAKEVIEHQICQDPIYGILVKYVDSTGLDETIQFGNATSIIPDNISISEEAWTVVSIPEAEDEHIVYFTAQDFKGDVLGCYIHTSEELNWKSLTVSLQRMLRRVSKHF